MRSGCLNTILIVGMAAVAAVVTTIGVVLFLFSASAFGPTGNLRTVIPIILAPVGIYLFYRVGRDVWRDLKSLGRPAGKKEDRDDAGRGNRRNRP